MSNRTVGDSGVALRVGLMTGVATTTIISAAIANSAHPTRSRANARGRAVVGADSDISAIHRSSSHRSCADWYLASGSLAKDFLTTRSSVGGVIGCSVDTGGGSPCIIAPIKLA